MALSVADLSPTSPAGRQWDQLIEATNGIDRWCSRLPWQRSVDAAFGHRFTDEEHDFAEGDDFTDEEHDDFNDDVIDDVVQVDDRWGYAFRRRRLPNGAAVLVPLDSVWAFASPVALDRSGDTEDFTRSVTSLVDSLLAEAGWEVAFVTGIEMTSELFAALAAGFSRSVRIGGGEPTIRCVASLDGGFDGYLSRRSRVFRRNLRASERLASKNGITFAVADQVDPAAIIDRLQCVERKSWKGIEGSGITAPDMARLYSLLVHELHTARGLRVTFAQRGTDDVGFILGGVLGSSYRGLQLSFVEDVRPYGVGNLLQLHEITRLADASVSIYDLGMDMPYKRLWSDSLMTTTPLILVR